jgi:transcriptional regulator with XRE-family HTH domain
MMSLMAEQTERTDFSDLVRDRRAELGISLRELEKRAVDPASGVQCKFGWLSKVENRKPVDAPSEQQLNALATGLDLPVLALQRAAAAQFLGLVVEHWSENRDMRILITRLEELGPDGIAELDEIAQIVLRRRRQSDGQD